MTASRIPFHFQKYCFQNLRQLTFFNKISIQKSLCMWQNKASIIRNLLILGASLVMIMLLSKTLQLRPVQQKSLQQFSNQYVKPYWIIELQLQNRDLRKSKKIDETIKYWTTLPVLKVVTKKLSKVTRFAKTRHNGAY